MAVLKKYNLDGSVVGEMPVEEFFFDVESNSQMIKDYIVALRANARQWSANTKTRSEVNHSTKKPFKQKGTGNARQGTLAAPQFRGGGEVFGPKPKFNQHVRINRKERRQVILQLLAEKIRNDKVLVVEDAVFSEMKEPKTKQVVQFLKSLSLEGRRVLFVGEDIYEEFECEDGSKCKVSVAHDRHHIFKKSMRNIPRSKFALAASLNGYEIALAQTLVLSESAWTEVFRGVEQVRRTEGAK